MKHPAPPPPTVSRETQARLDHFAALLLKWNPTINLVSRRDESALWDRHIRDSLALIPALPPAPTRAIDFGTGGGFPGLILAIATNIPYDLVESDQRKAAFLREAARETAAPARVIAQRVEDATLEPAPLITARAVAPLAKLLTLATPHLAPGGVCVFPKGRTVDEELRDARQHWHFTEQRWPNPAAPDGCILRLGDISHA